MNILTHRSRPIASTLKKFSTLLPIAFILMAAPIAGAQECANQKERDCLLITRAALIFLVDRSGSMDRATRGQSYNVQIEGIKQAVLDTKVIPHNGSLAIAVIAFADKPELIVPLKVVNSLADAQEIANGVDGLTCRSGNEASASCPTKGSIPGSFYSTALEFANDYLNANFNPSARRVLLLSSDGGLSDLEPAKITAQRIQNSSQGPYELDIALVGVKDQEAIDNEGMVNQVVFPKPANDLPGKSLVIQPNETCNQANQSEFIGCNDQVKAFATFTKDVLGADPSPLLLEVTTSDDVDQSPAGLSLRQAITAANNNGGNARISFSKDLQGKVIFPSIPLPALTQPDIVIDGCRRSDSPDSKCERFVTIDGSRTDASKGEKHGNGISIRSNRNAVRWLIVRNFSKAGIAIENECPLGCSKQNFVENNLFENNGSAAVTVNQSKGDGPSTFAASINVGNRISQNDISGSPNLIDLGGDGPTKNDSGDPDPGPNTLLNFPDLIKATVNGNTATVTGQLNGLTVNGPAASPASVEIFSVEKMGLRSGRLIFDEVKYVATTSSIPASGTFTAGNIPLSPTGVFTATVTDGEGNTSEMATCLDPPSAEIIGGRIVFNDVSAPINSVFDETRPFTVVNTWCAPLTIKLGKIRRDDNSTDPFFSVRTVESDDPIPPEGIVIPVGERQSFAVRFRPVVPSVTSPPFSNPGQRCNLAPLPGEISSSLTISLPDESTLPAIVVRANIKPTVQLINPFCGQSRKPASVTLARSGNDFKVTFAVYDPNLPAQPSQLISSYQFFNKNGKMITPDQPTTDLGRAIDAKGGLSRGQSFAAVVNFKAKGSYKNITRVRVKVTHGDLSDEAESGPVTTSARSLNRKSVELSPNTTSLPPAIEIPTSMIKVTRPRKLAKGR
ncbi:MAG TPA: vWA domain-containing protein [Blastocatellia bacterium]|nr:vWA domain-containing protein [Blastocatellia bacterium]